MRPLTGTHVYSYVKCARLAALDLQLPRSERRPAWPWEEFAAQRGRDFEAAIVANMQVASPVYPERDFVAGAAATMALLRAAVPLIHQGVLQAGDRLGLPDLLRQVPGDSELGSHHYEVVDVKTSGQPRADQILQVVFYSQLLAELQGRMPVHGGLLLKDGSEFRFLVADYLVAANEIVAALRELRADPAAARPFWQPACTGCYHDQRCAAELAAAQDLSLVQGVSEGARAILEQLGCRTVADLATFHPENARQRGNLDAALLRRLRRAAMANLAGCVQLEQRPRHQSLRAPVLLHLLRDPYADRVLAFGLLAPAAATGEFRWRQPTCAADEWPALHDLLDAAPAAAELLHFGAALPQWYERQILLRDEEPTLEGRMVDLQRRLHGAAVYPRPVFGLADFVRYGLGRDPWRAGHPGEAAMWLQAADGAAWLAGKLEADLRDMAALKEQILDAATLSVVAEGVG